MPARIAILVLLLVAAIPTPAWALAGGATGGGGGSSGGGFSGGGGGGFSGGSSGGSGGSGKFSALSLFITIGAVAFAFGLAFLVNRAAKRKAQAQYDGPQATPGRQRSAGQRAKKAEDTAKVAQAGDGYWDPAELKARVRQCFFPVQSSWSARDVTPSRPYVSGALFKRHTLQLEGLQLDDVEIVRVVDVTDDDQDRFVAFLQCRARDWMEDTETGQMVNGNKFAQTTFQQYWSFVRDPERGWVLDEIQQGSEGDYHMKASDIESDDGPARPAARA
jgi:predicted lipid-binding transport protein (Tim44 family)